MGSTRTPGSFLHLSNPIRGAVLTHPALRAPLPGGEWARILAIQSYIKRLNSKTSGSLIPRAGQCDSGRASNQIQFFWGRHLACLRQSRRLSPMLEISFLNVKTIQSWSTTPINPPANRNRFGCDEGHQINTTSFSTASKTDLGCDRTLPSTRRMTRRCSAR